MTPDDGTTSSSRGFPPPEPQGTTTAVSRQNLQNRWNAQTPQTPEGARSAIGKARTVRTREPSAALTAGMRAGQNLLRTLRTSEPSPNPEVSAHAGKHCVQLPNPTTPAAHSDHCQALRRRGACGKATTRDVYLPECVEVTVVTVCERSEGGSESVSI